MIILEIIKDWIKDIGYYIKSNLKNFAICLNLLLPFAMYFVGQYVCSKRDNIAVGSELIIPLIVYFVTYFIRCYANKIGKGTTIPLPSERFTEVDDDGEVSIDNNRVQELILYVADLEDWLNRKGLL